MNRYEVIVENVGTVHAGTNKHTAIAEFNDSRLFALNSHRAMGGPVTLMCNGEPVSESYAFDYEYTDTFGGEANYSWVHRGKVHARNLQEAVKLAKAKLGLSGVRFKEPSAQAEYGLHPRGQCSVLFVNAD